MKKTVIIFLFTLSFNYQSFAKAIDVKNDVNIYECLIAQSGIHDNIPIFYHTSLTAFKKYDFKNVNLRNWWGTGIINDNWKLFLNQININSLKGYKLTHKIGNHPFTLKTNEPFLSFSPVVYSIDKSMAVCSIFHYSNEEAASETIYLLEYKDGLWKIIKFHLLSIS